MVKSLPCLNYIPYPWRIAVIDDRDWCKNVGQSFRTKKLIPARTAPKARLYLRDVLARITDHTFAPLTARWAFTIVLSIR